MLTLLSSGCPWSPLCRFLSFPCVVAGALLMGAGAVTGLCTVVVLLAHVTSLPSC